MKTYDGIVNWRSLTNRHTAIPTIKFWLRLQALQISRWCKSRRNSIENRIARRGGAGAQYVYGVRRRRTALLKIVVTPDILSEEQFEELIIRQPLFWSSKYASSSYTSRSDVLLWLATYKSMI